MFMEDKAKKVSLEMKPSTEKRADGESEKLLAKVVDLEDAEESQAKWNDKEELRIQDYQLELENRIRNLLWTISGDYTQQMKPDVSLFLRSKDIALYDGIKQGALAKFFEDVYKRQLYFRRPGLPGNRTGACQSCQKRTREVCACHG